MIAVYIKKPFQLDLREEEPVAVGPDEVRVAIHSVGICGSDLINARTNDDWTPGGHEAAGEIVEIGPEVRHLNIGQRVVFENSTYCGLCYACKDGRMHQCEGKFSYMRRHPQSAFAKLITVPAQSVIPFDGLDYDTATLAEPMLTSLGMFHSAEVGLGRRTVVFGLGPIGLMALRLASAAGAFPIWAIDRSSAGKRLDLAKKWGATHVLCTDTDDYVKAVQDGGGVDCVMHSAPPDLMPMSTEMCAKDGIVAYCGISTFTPTNVAFEVNMMHFKRVQLRGVFGAPNLMFPKALRLLKEGVIPAEDIITHRFPLHRIEEAFLQHENDPARTIKVLIHPQA